METETEPVYEEAPAGNDNTALSETDGCEHVVNNNGQIAGDSLGLPQNNGPVPPADNRGL